MKKYTSKILLFGEHIVIKGAHALAMPLPNFSGQWQYAMEDLEALQMQLSEFADYLEILQDDKKLLCELDLPAFRAALSKGLFFDSNIPTGYGLGSSGALCAAVYQVFSKNALPKTEEYFPKIQQLLAQLESFFHGSSSGIDPLICYVEKTIFIESKDQISSPSLATLDKNQATLFLLDTKITRQTGPFVNHFLANYQENLVFQKACKSILIPENNKAIQAFLQGEATLLFEKTHLISDFQFKHFSKMIPSQFRSIWQNGLKSDFYKLKLCGAGGGGFMLGITTDVKKADKELKAFDLVWL